LRTPEEVALTGNWQVGVDFGTSFTNIYVNRKDVVGPLPLESLHLKVTDVQIDTRLPVLFEYFVPESFIPPEKPLPLSSVLTTRGKSVDTLDGKLGKARPVYDGRIYVPNQAAGFKPQEDWIETDLKWKNFIPNRLFIEHLALHISALAAKNGVRNIQWSLSYPSAFSRGDQTRYSLAWRELTGNLEAKTGITQSCPEISDLAYFRTESLAIAQYFADEERYDLVYSTCIDMGGGTSDISVWENNQLVHQCSIQLAGRNIFSQFLDLNKSFLGRIFELDEREWRDLNEGKFNAKLDVLLRLEGEDWLKSKRAFHFEDPEFQGFLRLIALGTAGIYYYVGTILGALYQEGKYSRNRITPVYVGGNGSRLLHWLAVGGHFDRNSEVNSLFSRMLSKGSGFKDTEEVTRLSQKPKDEVACGLVRGQTKLQGLDRKAKDPLIAGEDCIVNGLEISWQNRLDVEDDVQDFQIPKLTQLSEFFNDFNQTLKELEIDGLTPLPAFKKNNGLEASYEEKLWDGTNRELSNMLLSMKGEAKNMRPEPPFVMGLKALMQFLGKEWAGR
jgi:hypothetical protein